MSPTVLLVPRRTVLTRSDRAASPCGSVRHDPVRMRATGTTGGDRPPPPGGGSAAWRRCRARTGDPHALASDLRLALLVAVLLLVGTGVSLEDDFDDLADAGRTAGRRCPAPCGLLLVLGGVAAADLPPGRAPVRAGGHRGRVPGLPGARPPARTAACGRAGRPLHRRRRCGVRWSPASAAAVYVVDAHGGRR